jgi:hypothetical protein
MGRTKLANGMVEKFGLNPIGVNPDATETAGMFPQWHKPINFISDLYTEEEYKAIFIQEKYPWITENKVHVTRT